MIHSLKKRIDRLLSGAPKIAKDESGMTLLEITIASGIMMVMALGMASMMTSQTRQQQFLRDKGDHTGMVGNLQSVTSSPEAVSNSLTAVD